MRFKTPIIAAIILGTAFYTPLSLAAYGPAPSSTKPINHWTLSVGYGQTFGHTETDFNFPLFRDYPTPTVTDGPEGGKQQSDQPCIGENCSTSTPELAKAIEEIDKSQFEDDIARCIAYPYLRNLKINDLKIIEADLFHNASHFGMVYVATAEDGKITSQFTQNLSPYKFQALMAGYQFAVEDHITARFAAGMSQQKVKFNWFGLGQAKKDGVAANVNIRYNFPLSSEFNIFGEVGYLMQDKITEKDLTSQPSIYWYKGSVDPNAGYWKVGASFGM